MKGSIETKAKKKKSFITALASLLVFSAHTAGAEGVIEFDDIQVTSTTISDRFEDKRTEASNIATISGDEVDNAHTESIKQVLQKIPGITTEYDSGDTLKIHIRGVENQVYMGEKPGVAIVIDGVPVFERTGKVNIDMDNIESIKVIKGGASYLYGDDALSGAVIITTKRGAKHAGATISAEAGDFGYRKGIVRAGYAGDKFNGHLQISKREADGYYEDSAYEAEYADGKLQYYVDDSSDLTFGFEVADREKNSHGSVKGRTAAETDPRSTDTSYNDYANRFDVDLNKFFLTYSRDLSEASNLMVNLYQFSDDTKFLTAPLNADPQTYQNDNDYEQVQRGLKGEYRSSTGNIGWMTGVDLRDNSYDNDVTKLDCSEAWGACTVGELDSSNEISEEMEALYGEVKVKTSDRLVLTVNGRYDHSSLDYTDNLDPTENGNKSFDTGSWRLGSNYALKENMDIYANIATGFRLPSTTQLFVGSNSPSQRTDPNSDLKEEESMNYEIGMRTKRDIAGVPVDLDVAIFQISRKDHIRASAGQYTTSTPVGQYENIGDMRNRGLELSANTDPEKIVSFDLAYTYLDAKFTKYDNFNQRICDGVSGFTGRCNSWATTVHNNAGNDVPRTPKHHYNLSTHIRPSSHWLITGEWDKTSSYFADEINQERISGQSVYNLLVNYDREAANIGWSFFLRVDNVLDRSYYNTARSSSQDGGNVNPGAYDGEDLSIVVNQGRTYTAGVTAKF